MTPLLRGVDVIVHVIVHVIVIGGVIVAVHVQGNDTVIVIPPVDSDLSSLISDLRVSIPGIGTHGVRSLDSSEKIVNGIRSRSR